MSCFQEGEEYGYYNFTSRSIKKIGYSTNITPEIIEQAAVSKVDLIITHHVAWDFVYGMKEACMTLLENYNIAHFFVHLPLDYVEFGTCISLLRELDADRIVKHSTHHHGSSTVAVGELSSELLFQELVERVSSVLKEPVFALQCNRRSMKADWHDHGCRPFHGSIERSDSLSLRCLYYWREVAIYCSVC
ncbi:Nif3-like dinuclear metal center hexameric protein [Paenibacillus sp. J5C_2022]|uniref:Nif3-like dinuclear metal center hexameric protein n=1 Tax=Paenibacillus sp. J5C2022 TaxID=2977129 RepID=UPI0021CFDC00|nr:Nif3-like dinuclear metal center hexameric protein [Paenibacillus sp. J5C2022]MCU6712999.1 Nif3-like dinuclear metal center hexameric protein [Paenibacillus sp. J5C2022]